MRNFHYIAGALSCFIAGGVGAQTIVDYTSPTHVFSLDDVQGGFDGRTFATDPSIVCTPAGNVLLPGTSACPPDIPLPQGGNIPVNDLYPVDSEFGFYVSDFVGAATKAADFDYLEGWVGNYIDPVDFSPGLLVADAPTDTFRVKPPLGTWCQGLGGTSVKCSTEHYSVLEHVLTCHETIPYDPVILSTGEQLPLIDPETGLPIPDPNMPTEDLTCLALDDNLFLIDAGQVTATPITQGMDGTPAELTANESTVLENIATSNDYAITQKDDGKVLYRWGNLVKRPNDVRIYARIPLPAEWKAPGADYPIVEARLIVEHWITNNPNDQLRPEDMENEGAIGRKPQASGSLPTRLAIGDFWYSTEDCYEGDGDPIPAGTVFRNGDYDPMMANPLPFSEDLVDGFTNAWYTSIQRDPFEWAYEMGGAPGPVDDGTLGALISGPRWRLLANKFGQDIPGLEVPLIECSPPPFQSDNIKYEVGERVTTVIDLLDWDDGSTSPLATSAGWVNDDVNASNTEVGSTGISINGLPLTEDFDLAVYIKGDRKPTVIYNARLELSYDIGNDVVFKNGFE